MSDFIMLTDGYKMDHRRQYPEGTTRVYSNFTPRASRIADQKEVVFFGLQFFLREYFGRIAQETFFSRPVDEVCVKYQAMLDGYLGPNKVGTDHIAALHRLGYIPLRFYALPEGTRTPLRMPMFTVENTSPEFFWVTNYFETLISSVIWPICTSATTAYRYRKLLNEFALKTTGSIAGVEWQGHDFSFRGMMGPEAATLSGAGHLLSFTGTDCVPAIQFMQEHYAGEGLIAGTVPATEHSVMCAGGQQSELHTFERLLELYPSGIVSVVSDTWDLWNVIDNILPLLKTRILSRDGKLVIRPDSGDPADILCGTPTCRGVIERLWNVFGGTVNALGYKVLDSHIGAIYGDSITEARARDICERLATNGFASTNVVLGIGSFTYQYTTRDVYGFAMKATYAEVEGEERMLFKDPITDDGTKRSARGRIAIVQEPQGMRMIDGLGYDEHKAFGSRDLLEPVWEDGRFRKTQSLARIRQRVS